MPEFLAPAVYIQELPGLFHPIPGLSASTAGFIGLADSGNLPLVLGINQFRFFPRQGGQIWGARASGPNPEWQYVNVRRLVVNIEHSISQGLHWVVFEPNGPVLWARLTSSIEGFLTSQWQSGSLQGSNPSEAFFVRCDLTTMTQSDIDNGRVMIVVGVAPVQPAEFVVFLIGCWTTPARQGHHLP